MLLLIAGPYRSGTNDDPHLIKQNLENLEKVSLPIHRKGHIPIVSEWIALPLMKQAGFKTIGDDIWNEMQYPIAHRILKKCDAVFRIPGESKGADQDVKIAKELGLNIYTNLNDIPNAE